MTELEIIGGLELVRAEKALKGLGGEVTATLLADMIGGVVGVPCSKNRLSQLLQRSGVTGRFDERGNRRLFAVKSLCYHLDKGGLSRRKAAERKLEPPPRPTATAPSLEDLDDLGERLRRLR